MTDEVSLEEVPGLDYRISRLEELHLQVLDRLAQLDRHARWVAPWLIEEIQPVRQLEDKVTRLAAQLDEQRAMWGEELHRMGQQISWHQAARGTVTGLSATNACPPPPPPRRWWQRRAR